MGAALDGAGPLARAVLALPQAPGAGAGGAGTERRVREAPPDLAFPSPLPRAGQGGGAYQELQLVVKEAPDS